MGLAREINNVSSYLVKGSYSYIDQSSTYYYLLLLSFAYEGIKYYDESPINWIDRLINIMTRFLIQLRTVSQ